jgi:hypothetical protein
VYRVLFVCIVSMDGIRDHELVVSQCFPILGLALISMKRDAHVVARATSARVARPALARDQRHSQTAEVNNRDIGGGGHGSRWCEERV